MFKMLKKKVRVKNKKKNILQKKYNFIISCTMKNICAGFLAITSCALVFTYINATTFNTQLKEKNINPTCDINKKQKNSKDKQKDSKEETANVSQENSLKNQFLNQLQIQTKIQNDENIIYMDAAASYPFTCSANLPEIAKLNGNSTGSNNAALKLQAIEQKSKIAIAEVLNCEAKQITFTSGATLSNNIVLLGISRWFAQYNFEINKSKVKDKKDKKIIKNHIISSKTEHKSVLKVLQYLEKTGFQVTYLQPDSSGFINPNSIRQAIRPNTFLVSIHAVNNELGTCQALEEIGKICYENEVIFHTDATQAFCKINIDVKKMKIDALTLSGHKIGTFKGIGAIYLSDFLTKSNANTKLGKCLPILFGGGETLCPGTRPTQLIAMLPYAIEYMLQIKNDISDIFNYLIEQLQRIPEVMIYTNLNNNVNSIVFIRIKNVFQKDINNYFKNKFDISAGSSCSSDKRSHVLEAIDKTISIEDGVMRISVHHAMTKNDVDKMIELIIKVIDASELSM